MRKRKYYPLGLVTIVLAGFASTAKGEVTKKFPLFIEPMGFYGIGLKNHEVGQTTTGETVKISGGGGWGLMLSAVMPIATRWEVAGSWGFQKSGLEPEVTNADGEFRRTFYLATLKYRIPLNKGATDSVFKVGGGLGLYNAGRLSLDLSSVGGSRETILYDQGHGFHLTADYEKSLRRWAFVLGLRYVHVSFDATSYSLNGVEDSPSFLKPEIRHLKGEGVDLLLGVRF